MKLIYISAGKHKNLEYEPIEQGCVFLAHGGRRETSRAILDTLPLLLMNTLETMDNNRFSGERKGIEPNAENVYYVAWNSLPLSCPMPEMSLWNSHPQVFIPLHETDRFSCMYCGATYILDEPTPGEVDPVFANQDIEARYLERVEQIRHRV